MPKCTSIFKCGNILSSNRTIPIQKNVQDRRNFELARAQVTQIVFISWNLAQIVFISWNLTQIVFISWNLRFILP